MKTIHYWIFENIEYRFVEDKYTRNPEAVYRVQYKDKKNWNSTSPWLGLKLLAQEFERNPIPDLTQFVPN